MVSAGGQWALRECHQACHGKSTLVEVLQWTGTWWSGVDDKKVKERAGGRERERERKKGRHRDPSFDGAKVLAKMQAYISLVR